VIFSVIEDISRASFQTNFDVLRRLCATSWKQRN